MHQHMYEENVMKLFICIPVFWESKVVYRVLKQSSDPGSDQTHVCSSFNKVIISCLQTVLWALLLPALSLWVRVEHNSDKYHISESIAEIFHAPFLLFNCRTFNNVGNCCIALHFNLEFAFSHNPEVVCIQWRPVSKHQLSNRYSHGRINHLTACYPCQSWFFVCVFVSGTKTEKEKNVMCEATFTPLIVLKPLLL